MNEPDWTGALCAQADPDAFYPENGGPVNAAKRICGRCQLRKRCLEWALATREAYGVWGGLSTEERRRLEREAAA